MQTYKYHNETKEYLHSEPAFRDPLESKAQGKDVWLLPADSTFEAPMEVKEGYAVVWSGDVWQYAEDHRGVSYWMPGDEWDTQPREMKELGPLPEDALLEAPEKPLDEQIEAAYAEFDSAVEARLNDLAATRRYSSINSACSYATSTDPQFKLEGEYCVQARDLTYRKCYDLLAEYMPAVLAGERPIPEWEEIEAQLPELVWPDGVAEKAPAETETEATAE